MGVAARVRLTGRRWVAGRPARRPQERFEIVFGFRSPREFFSVSANCITQIWKVERHGAGSKPQCISSVVDKTLKPKRFYSLLLQVGALPLVSSPGPGPSRH